MWYSTETQIPARDDVGDFVLKQQGVKIMSNMMFHEVFGTTMMGNTLDPADAVKLRKLERKSVFSPHGIALAPRERRPAFALGNVGISHKTRPERSFEQSSDDPLEALLREETEDEENGWVGL